MPEPLDRKRRRVYDYFMKAIEKPEEYPMLYLLLAKNSHGYYMCQSPDHAESVQMKYKLSELEQRLVCLEAKINRLAYMADTRMTLTEQRQDLLCKVLVKLTKPQK